MFLPKFNYKSCRERSLTGIMGHHDCVKINSSPAAVTRSESFFQFASSIKSNEYRTVYVSDDEQALEGPFWIAQTSSEAYRVDETTVVAGETIEEGF